ncbi:uncharacterized protein LOC105781212 [Gossypium raimondii]|uniref:uncharacterized protein LOC105781212 n=1 Tax=Gossypium raimondii TaxID=29730 RepID=UPI00227B79A2|nr:uncharacterized protein LOC105781212 [Gossypium raimondii]
MLVTTSHINPNFEGSVKLEVPINNGLLDPIKHSAITFKDYLDLNIINWEGGSSLGESGEGDTGFKIRGLGSKGMSIRSGRNLNRTIKGHGGRFKVAGISRRNQKSPSSGGHICYRFIRLALGANLCRFIRLVLGTHLTLLAYSTSAGHKTFLVYPASAGHTYRRFIQLALGAKLDYGLSLKHQVPITSWSILMILNRSLEDGW